MVISYCRLKPLDNGAAINERKRKGNEKENKMMGLISD